jgi:hypothetical protein
MPDIQISDPYTNKPILYKYDSEDRQLLVNLLHEYSEKLMQISQELELKKQQRGKQAQIYRLVAKILDISLYTSGVLLALISLMLLSSWLIVRYNMFVSNQFKAFESTDLFVIVLLLVLMISSLTMFQAPRTEANKNRMTTKIVRMIDLLEEDTRTIADKLEKVMRVTIEVQDQIEINLARKLELDLRIGDAQSALEYYHSVIGTR